MSEPKPIVEESYIFKGNPTEEINVDKEAEKLAEELSYDPEVLSEALIKIGERMLGLELYTFQRDPAYRIIYSMLVNDGAEITLLFSRQSGKSEVITFVAIVLGVFLPVLSKYFKELDHFKDGVKMGAFAPQLDQVDTIYSRCLDRIWNDKTRQFLLDPDINDYPILKANFLLKSGSLLKAQTGAKQSKIESKTYHVVFIDESQDMDTEKVRKSIVPMTAATFGTIVRLGTPNRYRGDFYYTILKNQEHDRKLSKKDFKNKRLHFEYDYKDVIKDKKAQFKIDGKKFHTLYEKAVERDKKSMGESSEQFRMSYSLEWLLDIGMFITERGLEDKLYNSRITFPTIEEKSFVVAGLDIASQRNSTVFTYAVIDSPAMSIDERPIKTIAGWLELEGLDYEKQFDIISEAIITNRVAILYVDNTGVGKVFVDRLLYHFAESVLIVPYIFTPQTKSDMWKRLDEDINNRRIIVPAVKSVRGSIEFRNFSEQMLNLQKMWNGNLMVCQKTAGFKDDYCDSLGLMNLAGNAIYQEPSEMTVEKNTIIFSESLNIAQQSKW